MIVNTIQASAKQVTKWFINRAISEVKNGGEYLTQAKLQKLLYYAKGFFYVFADETLFMDVIKMRTYGPVSPFIASLLKKYQQGPITEDIIEVEPIQDEIIIDFLEFIYTKIALVYDVEQLVIFTSQEMPCWRTPVGQNIKEKLFRFFFRATYWDDNSVNWIVPHRALIVAMARHHIKIHAKVFKELAQC